MSNKGEEIISRKSALERLKEYSNGEYVLESLTVSMRMIENGALKEDIMIYLRGRNNTEEIANNIANHAMSIVSKSKIKEEKKKLFVGLFLFLIGIGISLVTYHKAQQEGGSYFIAYGIVIYGGFLFIVSLLEILDIHEKLKVKKECVKR